MHPIQLVPFDTRKEQAGLTDGEIKVIEGRKHNKKNNRPL